MEIQRGKSWGNVEIWRRNSKHENTHIVGVLGEKEDEYAKITFREWFEKLQYQLDNFKMDYRSINIFLKTQAETS